MANIFKWNQTNQILDKQITAVSTEMEHVGVNNEKYSDLMADLLKLQEAKAKNRRNPISLDTIVIVGGNLLLALIVVYREDKHIISSKAWPSPLRTKGS